MRGLTGNVAIVPGGATKIGQAVVAAFRGAGVRVMVGAFNTAAGQAMVAEGGGVHPQRPASGCRHRRAGRRNA